MTVSLKIVMDEINLSILMYTLREEQRFIAKLVYYLYTGAISGDYGSCYTM